MQSSLLQALLQQVQQQKPPQSSPLPPQVTSVNTLPQQLLQAIQPMDQNTLQQAGFNALLQCLQQQTPQTSSTPVSSTQLLSDTLKMIAPVGQSPNDEQLLVMALHAGLSQGFDHKKAIETLHGVCPWFHVSPLLLKALNRSTTMLPICGRIITSSINLA
jgi:hypothetical protein